MSASRFSVTLDVSNLADLQDRLTRLTGEEVAAAAMLAVNRTAEKAQADAITRIVSDINLTQQYVSSRMEFTPAGKKSNKAVVSSARRGTTLGNFDPQQREQGVNWTNARIESDGNEFGEWPGWTRRTGDASRGVAEDNKQAGIAVEVKRGSTKAASNWFSMPLKGSGRLGVFYRAPGSKKYEQRYGPAVYQLFRSYLEDNEESIADDLIKSFTEDLDDLIDRVIP